MLFKLRDVLSVRPADIGRERGIMPHLEARRDTPDLFYRERYWRRVRSEPRLVQVDPCAPRALAGCASRVRNFSHFTPRVQIPSSQKSWRLRMHRQEMRANRRQLLEPGAWRT